MSNLTHRQSIIQEKRKKTPWRDFVMESAWWFTYVMHKVKDGVSRYPAWWRFKNFFDAKTYEKKNLLDLEVGEPKNFMNQLELLFIQCPKLQDLSFGEKENSIYAESTFGCKNTYLSVEVGLGSENVLYSAMVYCNCKNVFNSLQITSWSENIYFCKSITNSQNIFYSRFIQNSYNVRFSSNCLSCQECIACNNLTNQKFCIENKQYSEQDYNAVKSWYIKSILSGANGSNILPISNGNIVVSKNCSGSGIYQCNNIENGYFIAKFENGRNICFGDWGNVCTDAYDAFHVGENCSWFYGVSCCGIENNGIYCSVRVTNSTNIFYSYHLDACSFCLGCIWLKNKSYCILNKQYTKQERYEKVDEIFWQMYADWTLWDFFPASMNPFYFNDTAAYLIDPSFTKEEVTIKWYLRRDEPIKVDIPAWALVVKTSELGRFESFDAEWNWKIDPEILKYIIVDEQANVYRIVKMEYDFLMKYGLPLPRKHWLDRMKENFRIG